jgi:hypothetical protein
MISTATLACQPLKSTCQSSLTLPRPRFSDSERGNEEAKASGVVLTAKAGVGVRGKLDYRAATVGVHGVQQSAPTVIAVG